MENKLKVINWEKISVYFTGLVVLISLWTFLNQINRDISDVKERIAKLEVNVEHLKEKK